MQIMRCNSVNQQSTQPIDKGDSSSRAAVRARRGGVHTRWWWTVKHGLEPRRNNSRSTRIGLCSMKLLHFTELVPYGTRRNSPSGRHDETTTRRRYTQHAREREREGRREVTTTTTRTKQQAGRDRAVTSLHGNARFYAFQPTTSTTTPDVPCSLDPLHSVTAQPADNLVQ
jgi:hypothetical protein